MVPVRRIRIVRKLVQQQHLSQRSAARLAGVSRDVVRRVLAGKRLDEPSRPKPKLEFEELRPYVRCRKCGGRVMLPCRLCRLRRRLERKHYEQKLEQRQAALIALADLIRRRSA